MVAFVPTGVSVSYAYTLNGGGSGTWYFQALSVSVDRPKAEMVDITTIDTPLGHKSYHMTGDMSQVGSLTLAFLREPFTTYGWLTDSYGTLHISSANYSESFNVIMQGVQETTGTGELAKGTVSFTIQEI